MVDIRRATAISAATATEITDGAVTSVEKALQVIEVLFRETDPLPAREIAERVGITRSTTHRLLNLMLSRGWVERVPDTTAYRIGVKFLALAHLSTQQRTFLQEVRTVLERLARLSRETVQLGILDGPSVVYVDEIKGPERVAVISRIGGTMVAHETGLGLALLAASSDATITRYLAGIADAALRARVHQELARTQARAYGIALEPGPIGIRSLGVAIRSAHGTPVFGLGLIGPAPRFTQERAEAFAPHMVATARSLSMAFGWQEYTAQGDHQ